MRARVLAVFMGLVILDYADATGHADIRAFAQGALARTLED
jgi:hypothetical protein